MAFRRKALKQLSRPGLNNTIEFKDKRFDGFNKKHHTFLHNSKLIKDFAFIIYSMTSTMIERNENNEMFFKYNQFLFPPIE